MIIAIVVSSSFGFWVKRSDTTYTVYNSGPTQGYDIVSNYSVSNPLEKNYGVWVDLPQVNMNLNLVQSTSVALPKTVAPSQSTTNFIQFSDVSSDVEYESRSYKAYPLRAYANIIKISGRYEFYPNDNESYGFRFYNEHVNGLDYMSTFDAAGVYKRYFGNAEAGCTFNFNFQSGIDGGLIVGPTFHYLYKNYLSSLRYAGGVFGSYSYCNLKNFSGSGRDFFSYGLMGGAGMPIIGNLGGNLETYFSHEFFVGSLQLPYSLPNNIQFVCGVKKAFVFKDWNLSNWVVTIGASKRF